MYPRRRIRVARNCGLLADEEQALEGVRVFWAGMHHRSSLAVCIETARNHHPLGFLF
jgi:hypothetical protein